MIAALFLIMGAVIVFVLLVGACTPRPDTRSVEAKSMLRSFSDDSAGW